MPRAKRARDGARRAAAGRAPSRVPSPARPGRAATWVTLAAIAASAEVLRIGFFADDFHFLDVARRVPLARALGGEYGIFPWYRPLSRELFFALIAPIGTGAALAAHVVNIAAVVVIACLLLDLATRLSDDARAPVAALLFATSEFTRFLAAWASGFQDLLATALTLLAVRDHAASRRTRSALWILLAPLAKETGFLALPLVLLWAVLMEGERRPRRWMILPTAAALAAAALHVLVRLAWRSGGSAAVVASSPGDLAAALARVMMGFVGGMPVFGSVTLTLAAIAALAAFALMRRRDRDAGPAPERGGALAFSLAAALLGLAPFSAGVLRHLTLANAYYAFPAVPWLCVLAAILVGRGPRAARALLAPALALLVGWNVLALGARPPDPLADSCWAFRAWDWREAERLSVVSARLEADVRGALAVRPESLVVLLGGLPTGSFFQSEDGPACRVALDDPTVRAYYINGVPRFVERGRFAVLTFDPVGKRLVAGAMPPSERLRSAATAIFRGDAGGAWAYASWADSADYEAPDRAYARAAARLIAGGAAGYRAALAAGGLADSMGDRPAALAAAEFPGDPGLRAAYTAVLRAPMSAVPHAALAARLIQLGFRVAGGFELRVATALDPGRARERAALEALLRAEASNASAAK